MVDLEFSNDRVSEKYHKEVSHREEQEKEQTQIFMMSPSNIKFSNTHRHISDSVVIVFCDLDTNKVNNVVNPGET